MDIIKQISNDLDICMLKGEEINQYNARIIYSAISFLMRASAMDSDLIEVDLSTGASKRHVLDKCTMLLEEYLNIYPDVKNWFYENEQKSPIDTIRSRMLRSGDLIEYGYKTGIALPANDEELLIAGICKVVGYPITFYGGKTSGICWIKLTPQIEYNENEDVESAVKFTQRFFSEINMVKKIDDERTEYFNPYRRISTLYQCWENQKPSLKGFEYILTRRNIGNNMYEYYIEKVNEGISYIHKIDAFLIEQKENRRIMFGLRAIANNSIKAYFKLSGDLVKLTLRTQIPFQEERIIQSFGWPVRNINDTLNWLYPKELWGYISKQLINLNIILEEDNG